MRVSGQETLAHLKNISSGFALKHAQVVALSAERKGCYQCMVIPDLISAPDTVDFPWYPSFSPKKIDYQVGDNVWVWVSEDLWIGYVIDRVNIEGKLHERQAEVFDKITAALSSIDTNLEIDINYESCGYVPLSPSLYLVWDRERDFAAMLNVETNAVVALLGPSALVAAEELHIPGNLRIGPGESAAVRALELQDILDEIEGHIHVSPVGPVDPAKGADMAPLSAKIAQMRQTMESTQLIIT